MTVDPADHRSRPWRVHALARDFRLLDAWRLPIEADPARGDTFDEFYRLFVAGGLETESAAANALVALRAWLGRILRFEPPGERLPIPGCAETSVAARLDAADRARDRAAAFAPPAERIDFRPIYVFEDEALVEVSNRTIHALVHVGWVDAPGPAGAGRKTAELGVYVKSRGRLSDLYMSLIGPFRHLVVYPAWFASIRRRWEGRPRRDAQLSR